MSQIIKQEAGSGPGGEDLHAARFIVSSAPNTGGNYTTIQAAINAAVAVGGPQTIVIQPGLTGVYTENITLANDISLNAFEADPQSPNVAILGTITANFSGSASIAGIALETNGASAVSVSGSSATILNLTNCFINCTNFTGISFTSSSSGARIFMYTCEGNMETTGIALWNMSSPGSLLIYNSTFYNSGNSTTPSNNSAGNVYIKASSSFSPFSSSGTGQFTIETSQIELGAVNTAALIFSGSGNGQVNHCRLNVGTAPRAIQINNPAVIGVNYTVVNGKGTAAIDGTGTIQSAGLAFTGTTALITTTTQTVNPYISTIPYTPTSAATYTALSTDYYISVDTTSGAKTVDLPNSPSLYQIYIIKDRTGHAAANNITVTTPAATDLFDGGTAFVMNQNYASANFLWNGTSWEVT